MRCGTANPWPVTISGIDFLVRHESCIPNCSTRIVFEPRDEPVVRPCESSGTGNGRVRSCRDNVKRLPATGGRRIRLKGKFNTSELDHTSLLLMSQSCCQALPKGKRSKLSPESMEHTDRGGASREAGSLPEFEPNPPTDAAPAGVFSEAWRRSGQRLRDPAQIMQSIEQIRTTPPNANYSINLWRLYADQDIGG